MLVARDPVLDSGVAPTRKPTERSRSIDRHELAPELGFERFERHRFTRLIPCGLGLGDVLRVFRSAQRRNHRLGHDSGHALTAYRQMRYDAVTAVYLRAPRVWCRAPRNRQANSLYPRTTHSARPDRGVARTRKPTE